MKKPVITVVKNNNENAPSVLRRFTKKVSNSGILRRARSIRFTVRGKSELLEKRGALRRIAKHKETDRLKKLGKLPDDPRAKKSH